MVASGAIQMRPDLAEMMDRLSISGQGYVMIFLAILFAGLGLAMLWVGKYLIRGLRFLASLILDAVQRAAKRIRRAWLRRPAAGKLFQNASHCVDS
jgi:hypothetical protein